MDLLDGPSKPPPPPGAPKPKPDLEAVYSPFEDAALTAQIKEECQEPELPQQQRVNEVLELLANPTADSAASAQNPPAVEVQPAVDLLDLSPTTGNAPASVNLLGEQEPASVDLLGEPKSASVDLLGEQKPASVDLFGQPQTVVPAAPESAASGLDDFNALLLTQQPGASSVKAEPQASKSAPPVESTDLLGGTSASSSAPQVDEFEALLAKQPLVKSHQDSEDVEKIMEAAKAQASERYVPSTLDLSTPAPGEDLRDEQESTGIEGAHAIVERVKEVVNNVMPSNACATVEGSGVGRVKTEGFGSEDVFGGPEKKSKSLQEEASDAWSKFVSVLPEQVRQHIETPESASPSRQNEAPLPTNAASSSSSSTAKIASRSNEPVSRGPNDPVSLAPPAPASSSSRAPVVENAMGGSIAPMKDGTQLEADHVNATINRSLEGKWVPTYMRHQLAAGGHTTMPQGVNAHEYPADAPPPSMGSAFREMGQEVQENAQAMWVYMVAILSSLALQCQMCSQNAASTIHETTFADQEDIQCGPWVEEADLGLGPIRSRVQRTIQGATLDSLLEIARSKLIVPRAAPGEQRPSNLTLPLQQLVKAREVKRLDSESLILDVEVNGEALQTSLQSPGLVQLLGCQGDSGSQLLFREWWRIDSAEAKKATINFSNEHIASSQVILTIRTDVVEHRDGANSYCEVESRLFTNPRTYGQHLPPGLVEKLTQMHDSFAQLLHGAVLSLAQESQSAMPDRPNVSTGMSNTSQAVNAATSTAPLPAVNMQWPAAQKRPCSSSQKTALAETVKAQPGAEIHLDKNLLLQVADGI